MVIERAGHAGGGWPDGLAWVIFAVLLALLLLAIVSLALDAYYRSQGGARGGALGELDLRYARGEISREEFMERRAVLTGGVPPPAPPPPAPPPSEGEEPTQPCAGELLLRAFGWPAVKSAELLPVSVQPAPFLCAACVTSSDAVGVVSAQLALP